MQEYYYNLIFFVLAFPLILSFYYLNFVLIVSLYHLWVQTFYEDEYLSNFDVHFHLLRVHHY